MLVSMREVGLTTRNGKELVPVPIYDTSGPFTI